MKILEIPKDISLIFKFGKKEISLGDKIRYNTPVIDLNHNLIPRIYMKKIGFKPYKTEEGIETKEIKVNRNGVLNVADVTIRDEHSRAVRNGEIIGNVEDIFPLTEIFEDFDFILSKKSEENSNTIIVKKYKVQMNKSEEIAIKEIDNFELSFLQGEGMHIYHNTKLVELSELETFFNGVIHGSYSWKEYMPELIFNSFSELPGFLDIYNVYKLTLNNNEHMLNPFKLLSYYYYVGQKEYYFLSEYLIKHDMVNRIYELNPVFTGKDIPSPKDIFILSKISYEILKENGYSSELEKELRLCEQDPKIGVNGIKLIHEVLSKYEKISDYSTPFCGIYYLSQLGLIREIINTFDITPKVLLEKCIRASFNENLRLPDYLNLIYDYINMSKQLRLPLDKKLPQDVIRRHDLLQSQITYVVNAKVNAMFKKQVSLNEELLKFVPASSEWTIICPKTPNDLIKEGLEQNHCVGSYVDRVATGHSKVFFLRSKKVENISLVTIEMNKHNLLNQAKGRSNTNPSKPVMNFINKWIENINKNII